MHTPRLERISEEPSLTLIGIAGAGKSTLGTLLAAELGWAHVDTDRLLEAYYARPLQTLLDSSGLDRFLEMEEHLVATLMLNRTVVSTGGSVVYSHKAVRHLKAMGPLVHLNISQETFISRVGDGSGRGLCIGEKTHADLYAERQPLYAAAADFTLNTDTLSPDDCAQRLLTWLAKQGIPARKDNA